MNDEVNALQDNETWNPVRQTTDRDFIRENGFTKWNSDAVVKSTITKHAMWQKALNKWNEWITLKLLHLPVRQRHSGF